MLTATVAGPRFLKYVCPEVRRLLQISRSGLRQAQAEVVTSAGSEVRGDGPTHSIPGLLVHPVYHVWCRQGRVVRG